MFEEAEQSVKELKDKLAEVQLERDIYCENLMLLTSTEQNKKNNNVAFCTMYTVDNGEGRDTETCIGVFVTRALAMQAILDVYNKNKELCIDSFTIAEFPVDEPLQPDTMVQMVQYDEEAHCEVSTSILGIQCKYLQQSSVTNSYLAEYKVNALYFIK
jgi:hypothetical protein